MGCDDDLLGYVLSVKHSGWVGVVVSLVSSLFLLVYVGMTLISILWKMPLLDKDHARVLIGTKRRMIVTLFVVTLPIMDVSTIYAWRILPVHSGCQPPPDYFLLWFTVNVLNVITMLVAWFYVPYAQVMIYLPQVLYTVLAAFYILTGIARDQICGSTFAVLIPFVLGMICVYFVPIGMRISKDRLNHRADTLRDIESTKRNHRSGTELDSYDRTGDAFGLESDDDDERVEDQFADTTSIVKRPVRYDCSGDSLSRSET